MYSDSGATAEKGKARPEAHTWRTRRGQKQDTCSLDAMTERRPKMWYDLNDLAGQFDLQAGESATKGPPDA